jgi:PAS domain S-box-containing protein
MRDLLAFIAKPIRFPDPEADLATKISDLEHKLTKLQVSLSNMGSRLSEKTVQLAEERNKSMAVISNMADGLIVLDDNRRISQINPMTRKIFNLSDNDVLGVPFEEALPEFARAVADTDEPAKKKNEKNADGAIKCEINGKTVQSLETSLTDVQGKTVGEVFVLRDITHEEELARMREELISIVSHEIRSPLTMVTGYMSLVLRGEAGEVPAEQKEFLQIAAQNGERLTRLINDLLDLSRLSSGLTTLNLSRVDATYLVNLAYYNFQKSAQEKGVTLDKRVPEGPVYVTGDDNRLVQVLTNLVSNAVKFTPEGGRITIWIGKDKDRVALGVTDTGMGIAPEEQQKVFEKFFRSKNVAKRKIAGTGLGLPICRAILQAHKSDITVESTPGKGTTFSFRLAEWGTQGTPSTTA